MELALLVYGVSLLSNVKIFLSLLLICCAIWIFVKAAISVEYKDVGLSWRTSFILPVCLATILTLVPSERTAYVMVGAYATQKIATSDTGVEIGDKVITTINQKLNEYITENKNVSDNQSQL